jgi:hypothetical protein
MMARPARVCPLWTGDVPVKAWSSSASPSFVNEKWSNYQAVGRSFNHVCS